MCRPCGQQEAPGCLLAGVELTAGGLAGGDLQAPGRETDGALDVQTEKGGKRVGEHVGCSRGRPGRAGPALRGTCTLPRLPGCHAASGSRQTPGYSSSAACPWRHGSGPRTLQHDRGGAREHTFHSAGHAPHPELLAPSPLPPSRLRQRQMLFPGSLRGLKRHVWHDACPPPRHTHTHPAHHTPGPHPSPEP